ncbi:phosphonate ABC transporter ATP-binding protein [soil metagenome]
MTDTSRQAGTAADHAAAPADALIRLYDATVGYPGGVTALDGIDLDIAQGDFVVVVGLSGAGKSTLIRAINGLVPLTSGTLSVAGRQVVGASRKELRRLRADVGMVFQSFNLVKRSSVLANVLTGRLHATPTWRSTLGLWRADDIERALVALERVEIVDKAYVRAANLSGGQQQRVSIARVLAQEPKVVLADEPVASLDPPTADAVMADLQRINRELGITTIVNLHFLDLARRYGDRIIGMRQGRIVFDGSGEQADDSVFERIYGRSLTTEDVLGVDQPAPDQT